MKSATVRRTIYVLLAVLWTAYLVFMAFLQHNTEPALYDYITYHVAAENLVAGNDLYLNITVADPTYDTHNDFIYPPILAQALMPIVAVTNFDQSAWIWFALNIVVLLGSVALLNRHVASESQRLLFWLLPLLFNQRFNPSGWDRSASSFWACCWRAGSPIERIVPC